MASKDRLARRRVAYALALALLDDDSSSASSSSSDDSNAISTDDDLDVVMESERDLPAEFFYSSGSTRLAVGQATKRPLGEELGVLAVVFWGQSLLCELSHAPELMMTDFRRPIPPETSLLLFLYYCAHGVDFNVLSEKFGVGFSTCSYIIRRVAYAITELGLIKLPLQEEAIKISSMNERRTGVPQCVLSVDGTHIPIKQPAHSGKDYYNRKGYYSTIMQAAVDHNLQFRDVVVDWSGSVGDNRVFMNSELRRSHETWLSTFPERVVVVNNTNTQALPMFLLGDSAYANEPERTQVQQSSLWNPLPSRARVRSPERTFPPACEANRLRNKQLCIRSRARCGERDVYTENTDEILHEYNSKYPTLEDHNNQSSENSNNDQMSRRVIEKLLMSC